MKTDWLRTSFTLDPTSIPWPDDEQIRFRMMRMPDGWTIESFLGHHRRFVAQVGDDFMRTITVGDSIICNTGPL